MKSMKQKLSSKSGASMLLALVFLLFCLMVGGSVLSAASANGSRAARKKVDQQAYLSQRSATLLLADMLKSTDDSAMQLTIKDVNDNGTRTVTFMVHGKAGIQKSAIQRVIYDLAVRDYFLEKGLDSSKTSMFSYVNFLFAGAPAGQYLPSDPQKTAPLTVELQVGTDVVDTLAAQYKMNDDGDFSIDFAVPLGEGKVQPSYVGLTMKCYSNESKPVTVNGVTTTTTIIRWDDPVIEKGGA